MGEKKITIVVGVDTELNTSSITAAATKMQQIISKSGAKYDMKQSAMKQMTLIEASAKQIDKIMSKPKINPNDINQLRTYNQTLIDSTSKLSAIYSGITAGASQGMIDLQNKMSGLMSQYTKEINVLKSAFANANGGLSFNSALQSLDAIKQRIENLKNEKINIIAGAETNKTNELVAQNQVNQQRVAEIQKTENDILAIHNLEYQRDFKSYSEFQSKKMTLALQTEQNIREKELVKNQTTITTNSPDIIAAKAHADALQKILDEETDKTKKYEALKKLGGFTSAPVTNAKDVISKANLASEELAQQKLIVVEEEAKLNLLKQEQIARTALLATYKAEKRPTILTPDQIKASAQTAGINAGTTTEKTITELTTKETLLTQAYNASKLAIDAKTVSFNKLNASLEKELVLETQTNSSQFSEEQTRIAEAARLSSLELDKNAIALKNSGDQALKASIKQETFGKVGNALNSTILRLTSAYLLFSKASQVIRTAVTELTGLDNQMTQIGIVTMKTGAQYWALFDKFNESAQELSTTTSQYLEGAKIFYQQGLNNTEVFQMVAATTRIAALSEVDFTQASETLTAAIRAYNMTAADAESVTDKLAAVGAASAADFHELSVAMEKVASAAYTAGMSFDSLLGILGKGIETTREAPEAIGTALKTVIARFEEMKIDPMSELTDGGNANRVEKALKTIGVALRDSNGQFRDLDEVFNDLGATWDTLTRNQKAYIGTMAAGARQQSRFLGIMNNYDRTLQLIRVSTNSAGAADKQYAIYTDSVTAAHDRMKNSLEALYASFGQSGLIKEFYNDINVLVRSINTLNPALLLGGAAIAGIGLKIAHTVLSLKAMAITTTTTSAMIKAAPAGFSLFTKALVKLSAGTLTAASAMTILNVAIAGVFAVIIIAIVAYTKMKAAAEEAAEAVHKYAAATMAIAQTDRQDAQNLKTKIDRYQELKSQLVKTNEEQTEYLSLIQEIADTAPDLVTGIDDQGNYILAVGDQLISKIKEMEAIAREAEEAAVAARIASMQAAKWNADVSKGAPGEKTATLSSQMTQMMDDNLKTNGDWLGFNMFDQRNNIINAGIEAGKAREEVLAELIAQEKKDTNELSTIRQDIADVELTESQRKFNEGFLKIFDLNTNLVKVAFAETKKTIAGQLAVLGDDTIGDLEAQGTIISDGYKTLMSNISYQAIEMATAGIDENDFKARTAAILEKAPEFYDDLQKELESFRNQAGFERGFSKLIDVKEAGNSIDDLQKEIGDFFTRFQVDPNSEIGKTIADSLFDKTAFNDEMKILATSLWDDAGNIIVDTGGKNQEKIGKAFSALSVKTSDYFLAMFDYMDEGKAKSDLLTKFTNVLSDPAIAGIISDAYSNLDTTSATEVLQFNEMIATYLEGAGATADQIQSTLGVLSEATQTTIEDVLTFIDAAKKAYDELEKIAGIAKKVATGTMTIGDAFDYISTYGREAALTLKHVGDSYFISFAELQRQANIQLTEVEDNLKSTLSTLKNEINTYKTNIAEQNQTIVDETLGSLMSEGEFDSQVGIPLRKELAQITMEYDSAQKKLLGLAANYEAKRDAYNSQQKDLMGNTVTGNIDPIPFASSLIAGQQPLDNMGSAAAEYNVQGDAVTALKTKMDALRVSIDGIDAQYQEDINVHKESIAISQEVINQQTEELNNTEILAIAYQDLVDNMKKVTIAQQSITNYQDFMDSVGAINAGVNSLAGYGDVFNKLTDGSMTFLETMQEIGKNPDLLAAMEVTDKGIEITKKGLLSVAEAKKAEVSAFLDGEIIKLESQLAIVNASIANNGTVFDSNAGVTSAAMEGSNAEAEASANSTSTVLRNKALEYDAAYKLYEVEWATAKLRGTTTDSKMERASINTEAVKAAANEADAIMRALREKFKDQTDRQIAETLRKEIYAAMITKKKWEETSAEALLRQGGGGGSSKSDKGFDAFFGEMDKYINYLEKIKRLTEEISRIDALLDLQSTTGAEEVDLIAKKAQALADQIATTKELIAAKEKDLKINEQSMKNKYSGYVSFDDKGSMTVRWDMIKATKILSETDKAWYDQMIKDIEAYNELHDALGQNIEDLLGLKSTQEKMQEDFVSGITDTLDQIYQNLVEADKKEVNELSEKYDKMKKLEDDYLSAIEKSISKERDMRSAVNKENDLKTKQRRLAILQQDTSGVYSQEIAKLKAEISNDQQTLVDSKIDAQLNALKEQISLAQKQRDLQIENLNAIIKFKEENGIYWDEAYKIIAKGPAAIKAALLNNEKYLKASALAQKAMEKDAKKQADIISKVYKTGKGLDTYDGTVAGAIETGVDKICKAIGKAYKDPGKTPDPTPPGNGGGSGSGSGGGENPSPTPPTPSKIAELQTYLNHRYGAGLSEDGKLGLKTMTSLINHLKPLVSLDTSMSQSSRDWINSQLDKAISGRSVNQMVLDMVKKYFSNEKFLDFVPVGTKFKTGGLADFTGPAWVDGSKRRPEAFLNPDQTQIIAQLATNLESRGKNGGIGSSIIIGDIVINFPIGTSPQDTQNVAKIVKETFLNTLKSKNISITSSGRL